MVVTQASVAVSGSVTGEKGSVQEYTAVMFPEDPAMWTPSSLGIAAARADQRGQFRITGLSAGRYLIAALDYLEEGAEFDPELLARLRDRATSLVLTEGESRSVALRLVVD